MSSVRKRGEGPKEANGHLNGSSQKVQDVRTDLTRWRLRDDRGRQTWHYLETDEELKAWPMSVADRHFLGLDTVSTSPISKLMLKLHDC
jgi:lanosterol synthase